MKSRIHAAGLVVADQPLVTPDIIDKLLTAYRHMQGDIIEVADRRQTKLLIWRM